MIESKRTIEVVKKGDNRSLDDPDWRYIERHIQSLRNFIDRKPERAAKIVGRLVGKGENLSLSNQQI